MDNEPIDAEVAAFNDPDSISDSKKGQLACTPYRLVYVNGNNVTDISVNAVNSIEYEAAAFKLRYVLAILGFFILGAFSFGLRSASGVIGDFATPVGIIFFGFAIASSIQGFLRRRATLRIRTPNKTYSFISSNPGLDTVGHAVRGHEMSSS